MYWRELNDKARNEKSRSEKGASKRSRRKLFLLTSLLALIVPALLAACGDAATPLAAGVVPTGLATTAAATSPAQTSLPAGTAPATPSAPTTPATTAIAQTATPASATPAPATAASTVNPAVYHPVIRFSSDSVVTGESLTVSGEGYPANLKLNIQLGPQDGKVENDSTTTADSEGKFKTRVYFVTYPDGAVVKPGKSTIAVATEDGNVKASATVTVLGSSPGRVSPVKLIQDFFAAFKNDQKTALAYLGTDLQEQIKQGKTTLPLLLGVQNVPESVSVTPAAGKDNVFDVYENFQGGKQYIQMIVTSDSGGKLKITNIIIPNPPPVPSSPTPDAATLVGYQTHPIIEQYAQALGDGQFDQVYKLFSSKYQKESGSETEFAKSQQQTLKQLKVVALDEAVSPSLQPGRAVYLALFLAEVGPQPSNWSDGNNKRWVEMVKEGDAWKINQVATSPIS
jgi:hypothetical protein